MNEKYFFFAFLFTRRQQDWRRFHVQDRKIERIYFTAQHLPLPPPHDPFQSLLVAFVQIQHGWIVNVEEDFMCSGVG